MQSPFEMIKNVENIESTNYIELLPGEYTAKYWNENSVYFADEAFRYFYNVISRYVPSYSIKTVTEIKAETWTRISKKLKELAEFLSDNPPMIEIEKWIDFDNVEESIKCFDRHKELYIKDLIRLIKEFTKWLEETCKTYSYITILGI
ncbi:hypothetical protein CN918_30720 [Priestia megaterium]|nr:hypothetical protein CN918_30720 [Priestia megaterium]